jgi:hypothetical protein
VIIYEKNKEEQMKISNEINMLFEQKIDELIIQ